MSANKEANTIQDQEQQVRVTKIGDLRGLRVAALLWSFGGRAPARVQVTPSGSSQLQQSWRSLHSRSCAPFKHSWNQSGSQDPTRSAYFSRWDSKLTRVPFCWHCPQRQTSWTSGPRGGRRMAASSRWVHATGSGLPGRQLGSWVSLLPEELLLQEAEWMR